MASYPNTGTQYCGTVGDPKGNVPLTLPLQCITGPRMGDLIQFFLLRVRSGCFLFLFTLADEGFSSVSNRASSTSTSPH